MKFKRILFKISGEALAGDREFGYDENVLERLTEEIKTIAQRNIQLCLVVGGGNLFRGNFLKTIDRNEADHMGMLATIMNGLALRDKLLQHRVAVRLQSALAVEGVCNKYDPHEALKFMNEDEGKVLLFVAGTGNPFFTTDTASVLRALEMKCDVIFKGTQVDGVYEDDPRKVTEARRYKTLSFEDAIKHNLSVMDQTAFALARANSMPIVVFKLNKENSLLDMINNDAGNYTLVSNEVKSEFAV